MTSLWLYFPRLPYIFNSQLLILAISFDFYLLYKKSKINGELKKREGEEIHTNLHGSIRKSLRPWADREILLRI